MESTVFLASVPTDSVDQKFSRLGSSFTVKAIYSKIEVAACESEYDSGPIRGSQVLTSKLLDHFFWQ